jgi:hypothetical protein
MHGRPGLISVRHSRPLARVITGAHSPQYLRVALSYRQRTCVREDSRHPCRAVAAIHPYTPRSIRVSPANGTSPIEPTSISPGADLVAAADFTAALHARSAVLHGRVLISSSGPALGRVI